MVVECNVTTDFLGAYGHIDYVLEQPPGRITAVQYERRSRLLPRLAVPVPVSSRNKMSSRGRETSGGGEQADMIEKSESPPRNQINH